MKTLLPADAAGERPFIIDQDFAQPDLTPALGNENPDFIQKPDGRQYPGPRVSFPIQIPLARYRSAVVQLEVTFQTSGAVALNGGDISLNYGGNQTLESSIAHCGGYAVSRRSLAPTCGRRQRFEFNLSAGVAQMQVDGETFLQWNEPSVPGAFTGLLLSIWGDPLIHRLTVQTESAPAVSKTKDHPVNPFQFQVTIDFVDDLFHGIPYGKGHFDSMLDHFEQWGVKRIYWIYYEHAGDNGFYEDCAHSWKIASSDYEQAVKQTFALTGDPLNYLISRAHARGMEVYGLFKPFELGYSFTDVYPFNTPEAKRHGRIKYVDGWTPILAQRLRQRPDCLIRRRPGCTQDELRERRIRTINLCHFRDESLGFRPEDIRVWISHDNNGYQPYPGPLSITERKLTRPKPQYDYRGVRRDGPAETVRALTIDGLDTEAPFVAVTVPPGTHGLCANALFALAEVLDQDQRPLPFTYGLAGNPVTKPFGPENLPKGSIHYDSVNTTDIYSLDARPDGIERFIGLGRNTRFLAFAKGKNPCLAGAPEAAYPEVRAFWLDCVRDLIQRGADGVDFRARNHNNTFEWSQYGYNEPIVAEFRRRHGIDIISEDFDVAAWRRLRGEYYTEFIRAASAELHAAGRKCQVHLGHGQDTALYAKTTLMNMFWDWRTWIEQGYVDAISNKGVSVEGPFWEEVRRLADARRIPIYCTPSCGTINFRLRSWREEFRRLFDYARESGQGGFNLYECAELLRPRTDQPVLEIFPKGAGFTEFMREYQALNGVR